MQQTVTHRFCHEVKLLWALPYKFLSLFMRLALREAQQPVSQLLTEDN